MGGDAHPMNILVTGGGGFLGGAIVRQLIARGHAVTALGRGTYPRLAESGIQTFQADIRDRDAVYAACAGRDAVIHTAAIAGIWGGEKLFWDINHQGTLNVLAACRDAGVRCLVHTSSPSVVFGAEELCGVNESHPYPPRHLAPYPASKAAAEQAVLRGNSPSLRTVALRPHLIFGPGDPHLFPRIIARARARKLVQVGHGTNLVDVTYIDNAALAHVLALDNLASSASAAGRAFFISQGEPVNLWSWLRDILARLELPPPADPSPPAPPPSSERSWNPPTRPST